MGGYEDWAEKDSRHAKVQRAGLWGGGKGGTLQQVNFGTFIVATACTETSASKHWRNRNRFKRAVLLWLPGRKKSWILSK